MKIFLFLTLLAVSSPALQAGSRKPVRTHVSRGSVSTCGQHKTGQFKIVGGKIIAVESQPWIASIFLKGKFHCGGTLISPCWVLTAAHCFVDDDSKKTEHISIFLGKNAANESDARREQKFRVHKLITHEAYNDVGPPYYDNDIALLNIKGHRCAKMTDSVQVACLPPPSQMLPPGSSCQVIGYGIDESRQYSQYLKEATVQLVAQEDCTSKTYYWTAVTDNMFCASSPTWTTDACNGDSGGPLVCKVGNRMFLFGIVSWGDGCAKRNRPGVYTRVTNYNTWIQKKTRVPGIASGAMYPQK